jgi:hypothetical protein
MALTDEQLLAIPDWRERVRLLTLEAIHTALTSDVKPQTVAEAVYNLRTKAKCTTRGFAARLHTGHAVISRLEAGISRSTPSLLRRLVEEANANAMSHTAEYLQSQAAQLEREIRIKGGKR